MWQHSWSLVLHLLLTSDLDLDAWKARSNADLQPHHLLGEFRDAFGAAVHPPTAPVTRLDRMLATLCDTPEQWASARALSKRIADDDVVFSVSEDMTLPLVAWLQMRRSKATVITSVMNPGRTRMKVLFRAFNARRRIARFVALTPVVETILRDELGIPAAKVSRFPMETDFEFFRPVESSGDRRRPLLYAAGLEQRDYATLAEAVRDLEVDVEVCATSPNASSRTRTALPDSMPPNMRFHPYEWVDFRRMYSEADIVVVAVLPNRYGAGLTTMVEGLACGRPVIVTDPTGLPGELARAGALVTVEPQNPDVLRDAIEKLLADPVAARRLGEAGREVARAQFSTRRSIETLAALIGVDLPAGARVGEPARQ
jgi:glycosyltransferase involved in cell wall biosynthesis